MSDYLRVTFREPMQQLKGERSVRASDTMKLRKATDSRRPSEGVELVHENGDVEFFGIDKVSSITYAPAKGGVKVAEAAPPEVKQEAKGK